MSRRWVSIERWAPSHSAIGKPCAWIRSQSSDWSADLGSSCDSVYFQYSQKGFLRNVYVAHAFHALLAFFLLFQELAFATDITAVALGGDVFAHGSHRLAGDAVGADGRLDRDFILLPGNQFLELGRQSAAPDVGSVAVHDGAQRIQRVAVQEQIQLYQIGG